MTAVSPLLSFAAAYRSILQTDGGARIFQEFGFVPGQRYISPLRPDATKKNFSVFRSPKGEVCFKDFVNGDGGTFTALLSHFGYTSFEAQIRFAAQFYGIEVNSHSPLVSSHSAKSYAKQRHHQATKPQTTNDQYTNDQRPSSKFYRVTALELTDFTTVELQALERISAGLITKELLERFGIRALRSYTDEGRTEKGISYGSSHEAAYTLVVPSADGNYYAYCYYQSDKHSPFPNKAKNFHLKLGEYASDVKFALGLTELRPNEPAYIVEGIKDCLILLAKGYNAFTLGGVQHRLHPSVTKHLQENGNSLNIVFDTDFAGISAAQKLSASLKNTQSTVFAPLSKGERGIIPQNAFIHQNASIHHAILTLPRLERQETKDSPKPLKNDLADYVVEFGFDELLRETLLSPAPLNASTITKGSLTVPAWQMTIENKLAEDKAALKTLEHLLESASRLVLRAPAGCGKTYSVLRHLAKHHYERRGGMTVFAVPTIAMAEQIKQEYHELNPIVLTGEENDLHRLYDAGAPLDTYLIVTVFDSASRLLDIISEPSTLFVVDEAHKTVQDYGFRTSAMRIMNCLMKQARRVLCLTATPELLFHETPMSFTFCDIAVQEKRPVRFIMQDYDKREKVVVGTILQALKENSADIIMVNINSKSLLKRTQTLLVKHGVPESEIDIITSDTRAVSPEYKHLTNTSRCSRKIILTTTVLDCGVNILNEGRALVIMLDEKNEDAIVQIANRFRMAEDIFVRLFYAREKRKKQDSPVLPSPYPLPLGEGKESSSPPLPALRVGEGKESSSPPLPALRVGEGWGEGKTRLDERHHFHQTRYSAEMFSDLFNRTAGRNTSADCGLGRKSASRLQDTMTFYHTKTARWTVDECAIMHCLSLLRIAAVQKTDLIPALGRYGFTFVIEEMIPTNNTNQSASLNIESAVSEALTEEVRAEAKREAAENEEIILRLLEHKTAYFLAALNTISRSKSLKNALHYICPDALLFLYKNHDETAAILTNHASLLSEARTDTLVRYYTEARTLGFDHKETIHLVRENRDPRKWTSFTERLAMKQREEIHLAGLTDKILSKHDCEKLRREEEIRSMIRNSAKVGCTFTGADGTARHIPYAIRTKKEIAERVNAYTGLMFRIQQQKAGELTDAMYHVSYVRERVQTESVNAGSKTRFGGYYAFAHDGGELRRKTLAEFVCEYGVAGREYEQRFMEASRVEARRYEKTTIHSVLYEDSVCAGSLV